MNGYKISSMSDPSHSIHLHGHGFAVMAIEFDLPNVDEGVNNSNIVCDSTLCAAASWNMSRDV